MKLNVFRNPFIDAQVSMLMGTLDDARRRETEAYWRTIIVNEILDRIENLPKDDGGYCHTLHYCDVVELIELSKGNSHAV